MSGQPGTQLSSCWRRRGAIAVAIALCSLLAAPAEAIEHSSGDFTLNLDTTLSWGARYRLGDPDLRIVGLPSGGEAFSVNGDDGTLNFDKGISSNVVKATIDLALTYKNVGAFVRGSGFYDFELMKNELERTELTDEALDWAGNRAELLDAFAWWQFDVGQGGGQLRFGRQVLNWGESTFIQGGISVINPVDVSALRVPGAELREAFRPLGMLSGSVDLSSSLSLEAFYEFEWEPTVIDPPGTYFSTNDFAGRGGSTVFLGFGSFPDTGESPFFVQPPLDRPFLGVGRGETQEAKDGGQYGAALRWFADGMGGTEFGLYFMNYHSRLPTINAVTGTIQGAIAAAQAGPAAAAIVYQTFGVPPGVSPEVDALAAGAGSAAATDAYAATARYFTAYPEDIKLYGLSFNTQVGTSGIALQGEVSYHQDLPLQVDDVELLFAALSPISPGLAATNQVVPGGAGFAEVIEGFRRKNAMQVQMTATKVLGPILGADQGLLLLEPGYRYISGMEGKSVLRYEGPGTYTSGNPIHAAPGGAHAGKPEEAPEHFADANSWGYRFVGRLVYNNAIGAFNLIPRFGWQHDVDGVTPGPGGSFIEGRTAFTLGLGAEYQNRWQFDLSWTTYGGAGRYNLINDRDFLAANVKYSF
jgi:hypothetical protein